MRFKTGFTLIELVMVLMILVIVASLSIPFAYRSFSSQRISKAADQVRAELNNARVQAMRTGEIYGFFYFPETQHFKVASFNEEMVSILDQSNVDPNEVGRFDFGKERLPRGVVFAEGVAQADSRSALAERENQSLPASVRPVLFYPDGSSQSAKLYIRSDQDDYVQINLRGMTGTSSTAPVKNDGQVRGVRR